MEIKHRKPVRFKCFMQLFGCQNKQQRLLYEIADRRMSHHLDFVKFIKEQMFSRMMRRTIFTRKEILLMSNQKYPFLLDEKDAESSSQNESLMRNKEITSKYF